LSKLTFTIISTIFYRKYGAMNAETAKGIVLRSRMTTFLDDIREQEEISSDEDEPQIQNKKAKDYTVVCTFRVTTNTVTDLDPP
jgi:hypothetical protein